MKVKLRCKRCQRNHPKSLKKLIQIITDYVYKSIQFYTFFSLFFDVNNLNKQMYKINCFLYFFFCGDFRNKVFGRICFDIVWFCKYLFMIFFPNLFFFLKIIIAILKDMILYNTSIGLLSFMHIGFLIRLSFPIIC